METVQMTLQRKIEGKSNALNGMNGDSKMMGRKMSQVCTSTFVLTVVHIIRRLGKAITVEIICIVNCIRNYTAFRERSWPRRSLSQRHPSFI
jgi:hypothetical protein